MTILTKLPFLSLFLCAGAFACSGEDSYVDDVDTSPGPDTAESGADDGLLEKAGDGNGWNGNDSSQDFHIVARNSGRYFGIRGGSTNGSKKVILWNASGNADQRWHVVRSADVWTIQNVNSGHIIGPNSSTASNGNNVVQDGPYYSTNRWWIEEQDGNWVSIHCAEDHADVDDMHVIGRQAGGDYNGVPLRLQTYEGDSFQQFKIIKAD